MSAIIIPNPDNVPSAVTTGYQLQNTVLFAAMTGLINISVDTVNKGIRQGSIFELNGNIVRVTTDVGISGSLLSDNKNFVYAIPTDDGKVNFSFSTTAPIWNANKGGWYLGATNQRALIECWTEGNNQLIGTMGIMSNVMDIVVPPNSGGTLVGTWKNRTHTSTHLERGWHRFVISSGLGAGDGKKPNEGLTSALGDTLRILGGAYSGGGVASVYNEITGVFFHQGGSLIIHVGGNGYSGGNSEQGGASRYSLNNSEVIVTSGQSGWGGGSGAGEESYIISGGNKYATEKVRPGNKAIIEKILDNTDNLSDRVRYPFGNGRFWVGAKGGIHLGLGSEHSIGVQIPGELAYMNDSGWGGFGDGGKSGCTNIWGLDVLRINPSHLYIGKGGDGGGGGAPGWIRALGDKASGYIQIWRLS